MVMGRVLMVKLATQLQILLTVIVMVGLEMEQMLHPLSLSALRSNGVGVKQQSMQFPINRLKPL
jgi:hypothetical protein